MKTNELIEALLYKMPEIRKAFIGLNIMNLERKISSSEHPEFKNILKPFSSIKIVSVVGLTQLTAIIETTKNGRLYPIILIHGNESEIVYYSKSKIIDVLFKHLKLKDYLPPPFVKKIIYIDSYSDKLMGVVFSECRNNIWTIDDPLKLPLTSYVKITPKIILHEIMDEIFIND